MMQRILRLRTVKEVTGLGGSTLYEMIGRGDFPGPIRLGARAVGWPQAEVEAWIESRIAASRISDPSHPGREKHEERRAIAST